MVVAVAVLEVAVIAVAVRAQVKISTISRIGLISAAAADVNGSGVFCSIQSVPVT